MLGEAAGYRETGVWVHIRADQRRQLPLHLNLEAAVDILGMHDDRRNQGTYSVGRFLIPAEQVSGQCPSKSVDLFTIPLHGSRMQGDDIGRRLGGL